MKRYVMQVTSVILVLSILIFPSLVAARNFIDDWLSNAQTTGTSADYYEGQKRGYYNFGSFSARWPTSVDYPITIVPPRIKAGCGGIDLFAGSYSFVKFDYLVSKLQKMIQSAPAVAFDIALQVLSEQLRNAGIDIEGILNKLNSLQFDDCKASKALVATIAEPGFSALNSKLPGEYANAVSDFLISSGSSDLYKEVQQKVSSKEGKISEIGINRDNFMDSCPKDIKDIFAKGSLVNNITRKFGYSEYSDMIRGMIGDIAITEEQGNVPTVTLVSSCIETDTTSLESFLEGNIKARTISTEGSVVTGCVQIKDEKRNIIEYVKRIMRSYVGKIKNKQAVTTEEDQFIKMTPFPIALVLKHAIAAKQEDYIIETLSEMVAYNLINKIMIDFLVRIEHIIELTKSAVSSNQGAIDTNERNDQSRCNLVFSGVETAKTHLSTLKGKVIGRKRDIQEAVRKYNEQINTFIQLTQRLEYFNEKVERNLVNIFSKGVANRVIK